MLPPGRRRRRAEAVRRARRRPARRRRRAHARGRRARPTLLPGKLGAPVDRTGGRGARSASCDYSHPVFEVFKAPRSGDFSAAHVFRYRALEPAPDRPRARALRRWRGGGGGAAGRHGPRHRVDDDARRLVDRPRRSSRSTCRSCTSWCAIWRSYEQATVVAHGRPGLDLVRSRSKTAPTASSSPRQANASRSRRGEATPGCSS